MRDKLYMAPILGITNCIYRNVFTDFFQGYDSAMAPFISACNIESTKSKALRDLFRERNRSDLEIIPQILSKDPKGFISVAKATYDLGYDTVNWNLGCPHKKVRNKMRGSGLLAYPDFILSFLDEIISAVPNKVSIKVRLGSSNADEIYELLPRLNDLPLKDITIHPRTAEQMYSGHADPDAFEKAISLTKHTVIYNGDIFTKDQFANLKKRFNTVDHWMIGRGGIVNPFLTEEIKGIMTSTAEDKLERFRLFHDKILLEYQKELDGPAHLLGKLKEHWHYWALAFENSSHLLSKVSKLKKIKDYEKFVQQQLRVKKALLI